MFHLLPEMPMDAEIIKDPITGKVYLKTKSGRLTELSGDIDVFIDPKTGKSYVVQKGQYIYYTKREDTHIQHTLIAYILKKPEFFNKF